MGPRRRRRRRRIAHEPGPAAGPAVGSRSFASGGGETFDLRASVRSQPDAFHNGTFRVWVPDLGSGSGVAGSFLYQWDEGEQVGLGAGALTYDGPLLNAPPGMDAIVHHVRNVPAAVGPPVAGGP